MQKIAWSYSRLTDFENCPLLFQHKHILKTIKFVANEAMERGKKIHQALEHNTVRAIHGREPVPGEVAHVQPIINNFVRNHQEILIEEKITFDQHLNETSWFSKDAWFRAVIDMVGRTNITNDGTTQEQTVSIIDWKTGQYRPSTDQLKLYNMAAFLKWSQVQQVTSALVFVDHKKSSPPLTTSRLELQDLVQEFGDRSEAIQIANEKDDWPAKKCFQCRWCGVADCQYINR